MIREVFLTIFKIYSIHFHTIYFGSYSFACPKSSKILSMALPTYLYFFFFSNKTQENKTKATTAKITETHIPQECFFFLLVN